MFEFTVMHGWLLFTAILFTFVGMWMVASKFTYDVGRVIEATIDRLIKDGYVKYKLDEEGNIELLRYNEDS